MCFRPATTSTPVPGAGAPGAPAIPGKTAPENPDN